MTITFRPAEMDGVGLFIAIAGGSRTGKTYSALTLARGIAGPNGKIAAIDTEGKRMSHYKNDFLGADGKPFDVYNKPPDFNGKSFLDAARVAQEAGYAVMVVDSFSLEWSGSGGVLHQHASLMNAAEDRLRSATDDRGNPLSEGEIAKRARRLSDGFWNRVKGPGSEHKLMMDGFLQLTMPVIFCLRANPVADHLGGGWKVDQDKKFLYEWTVALTLHPETPGMPRYDMVDAKKKPLWKVQEQHLHLFPDGKLISRESGAALQAWRNTDTARVSTSVNRAAEPPTPEEIATALQERFAATDDREGHDAIMADDLAVKQVKWLSNKHKSLFDKVEVARVESEGRTNKPAFRPAQDAAA